MKTYDLFHRLERIDQFIRLKATGTPRQFSSKLGVSVSMLYNYLDLLKSMGGPIKYNKFTQTFEYEHEVRLNLGYSTKKNVDSSFTGMRT